MKVFCFDKTDWVCADTKDQAIKFYINYHGIKTGWEKIIASCKEVPLTDTMWYGLYWDSPQLKNLIEENPDEIFEIRHDMWGDLEVAVCLSFKRVIEIEQKETPYLISSTEY